MTSDWEWEQIADHGSITEGPVWDGSGLIYSQVAASKAWRWDATTGETSPWRDDTNNANGLQFDRSGRLFACEGGSNRVVEINVDSPNDAPTVVAEGASDSPLNMPNDLAIDAKGRVYFSDPNYSGEPNNRENESVYMAVHTFGGNWTLKQVTFNTARPNGVLLSADQQTLYVADSHPDAQYRRELRAYPINADGTLGTHRVLFDFGVGRGIDGMTLTTSGHIVATAGNNAAGPGPMIYVFSDSGLVVSTHRAPQDGPTNCTFGGDALDELFVTFLTGYVYRVRNTGYVGNLAYPKRKW